MKGYVMTEDSKNQKPNKEWKEKVVVVAAGLIGGAIGIIGVVMLTKNNKKPTWYDLKLTPEQLKDLIDDPKTVIGYDNFEKLNGFVTISNSVENAKL